MRYKVLAKILAADLFLVWGGSVARAQTCVGPWKTGQSFTCPGTTTVIRANTEIPGIPCGTAPTDAQIIAALCGSSSSSTSSPGVAPVVQGLNPVISTAAYNLGFMLGQWLVSGGNNANNQAAAQAAALEQQRIQEELARRRALAERKRREMFERLNRELKGLDNNQSLQLKGLGDAGNLHLKGLGADSGGTAGWKLKLGDDGASAQNDDCGGKSWGIPGLPGIYLNDCHQPSLSIPNSPGAPGPVQVAQAAQNLSGPEREVVEQAVLNAAQKDPALMLPSQDPNVTTFQQADQQYQQALQAQASADQQLAAANVRAEDDHNVMQIVDSKLDKATASPAQQAALGQMAAAAKSDEDASALARQGFDTATANVVATRTRATEALAAVSTTPSPQLAVTPRTGIPASGSVLGANLVQARPLATVTLATPTGLNPSAKPLLLATPPAVDKPYVESMGECLARFSPTAAVPSIEDLRKKLERERDALKRLLETQNRENEDRNDWLKDMRKAAQDVGMHAIDHGIGNMLDSTKEGLTEAETELHAEIQEVKQEAEEAHQLRDAAQKAMGTAQGDPKRLAELQAKLDDIEKNKIGPLFEKNKALQEQWRTAFQWDKKVEKITTGRDFGAWLIDMDLPCWYDKNDQFSCKNFKDNNAARKMWNGDPDASLDGLKQVLNYAAHHADYLQKYATEATHLGKMAGLIGFDASLVGATWDGTSLAIDLIYDGAVGYSGYERLKQIKQNDVLFERAKSVLGNQIDRTNAEMDCYQKAH